MLPPNAVGEDMAELISPYLLVEEHPAECISFWAYFGVSLFFMDQARRAIYTRVVFILKIFENQIRRLTKGVYGQNMLPYQI